MLLTILANNVMLTATPPAQTGGGSGVAFFKRKEFKKLKENDKRMMKIFEAFLKEV
ncbi:MAG TPA: hypothetical protein PK492_04080 [Chitinophagaceae bacterium]|jgi:hypothetical protein|uniref:hypothetical protein n=1 Tax=Acinetobacter sp. TaxID=472 RepID=UPI001B4EB2A8|nr:hypothetical protein [Acinetobacter sp.]MBP9871031.1 hypothetical protein [Nitrosomonas sp.]HNC38516.1 hypothetical protein [Chitinophagaceae bacterium]HND96137.1 hypothetical protein [Chitinophagaceae bacterium]HXK64845.1 hypothetical protein [Spirochaetota bacterium]